MGKVDRREKRPRRGVVYQDWMSDRDALMCAAVNITLFTYNNGVAQVGIRSDPVGIADTDRLLADLREGFGEVLGV